MKATLMPDSVIWFRTNSLENVAVNTDVRQSQIMWILGSYTKALENSGGDVWTAYLAARGITGVWRCDGV